MFGKTKQVGDPSRDSKGCVSPFMLYRYLTGSLGRGEVREIERHLNRCTSCFNELVSLVRNVYSPMNAEERRALSRIQKEPAPSFLSKILAEPEEKPKKGRTWFFKPVPADPGMPGDARNVFIFNPRRLIPLTAGVLLLLMAFGLLSRRTGSWDGDPVGQARSLLTSHHQIFIEDARLSGGYASTGISMLMTPPETSPPYLEKARRYLLQAIGQDPESESANLLLAQTFLIENRFQAADSVFQLILDGHPSRPVILNDLGVFYAKQNAWEKAASHFLAALGADHRLLEARYNLALMHIQWGSLAKADSLLETYIRLETDEAWRNAALRLRQKIGTIKEPS